MDPRMLGDTPLSMPIDGIPWSWRPLQAPELPPLLPFVLAVDPSGAEAASWPADAVRWLAEQPGRRGLVGVDCLAGLTLGLFFYALVEEVEGGRRLLVERLLWLELTRPHRSLDALLIIVADTGRRLKCREIVIAPHAATASVAKEALGARAAAAGFAPGTQGWRRSTAP
jgi:hypothetical protein